MGRGLCPLAVSATHRVEAGDISGAVGLTKPIPKPTPGAPPRLGTTDWFASGGSGPEPSQGAHVHLRRSRYHK